MQTKQVFWAGPLAPHCQISHEPFNGVMYDARTPHGWANINEATFMRCGCQLGMGLGQKYEQQADGRWLKVAG